MAVSREQLVDAFQRAGEGLWVVGGALRDEFLGKPGNDEDFATSALPDQVEALAKSVGAPVTVVGRKWGTIGVNVDGRWSEITTFRGDSYTQGSRWPDVTFGSTIEEDLARRDFSVNAMARNAVSGELLDPFGGRVDIARQLIRAVGEPAARFREDPLRILRGLRFVSQLGFQLDHGTLEGMSATADQLSTLSQERVTVELDKLLQGLAPGRALELMRVIGALHYLLPELELMAGCEQNRFHRFDVWGHTVGTVQAIEGENPRLRRWSALLHDIGKPATRHLKANGEWGFYRHETAGAELAGRLLDRLKVGRRESEQIVLLVRRHMDRPDPADSRSVRRFMSRAEGQWRDLVALKRADNASHTYDDSEYHAQLEAACERVQREESDRLRAESPLNGDDLVELFDRPPGPWIRAIKGRLSAMVLDGELDPGDRSAAEAVARTLLGADSG